MLTWLGIFAAGLATLATPCVLPLVPVYLTMLLGGSLAAVGEQGKSRWRLFGMTLAFTAGFTLVFSVLGLGASALGGFFQAQRGLLTLIGAVLIVLFGLKFMGLIPMPWLDRDVRLDGPRKISGPLGGFGFGIVFGFGWTPCAGPVLASVLSLAALEQSKFVAAGMLATYSAGLALPLLIIAAFADRAVPMIRGFMSRLQAMQKVTGAALVALGLFIGWAPANEILRAPTNPHEAIVANGEHVKALFGEPLSKPRLVELYEQDCPVCKRMEPRVNALQTDCEDSFVDVYKVDISQPENSHLKGVLGVNAVPTLLLIDDQGAIYGRMVGERSLEEIRGFAAEMQASTCAGVEPAKLDKVEDRAGCGTGEDGSDDENSSGTCS